MCPKTAERKAAKQERLFHREQKAASTLGLASAGGHTGPRWRVPTVWKLLNQTSENSGVWLPGSGNRVKCAGRGEGLEAGTDPQTILAAGKGFLFFWVFL